MMARVAGCSLEQVDSVLGKLGNPIGIASYKPYQSNGEDFLHNYLGMIGIPIDLHPEFPTNADLVLLTECAKFDPDIVVKIKSQLRTGKSVVITSGLLRALQGKGIEDIVEARCTDRKVLAHRYSGGFGAGNFNTLDGEKNENVLFPQIEFFTNDAWSLVRAEVTTFLLLMDCYSGHPDRQCRQFQRPLPRAAAESHRCDKELHHAWFSRARGRTVAGRAVCL